jgi:hypothetical protein
MSFKIDPAAVKSLNDQELHQYILKAISDAEQLVSPDKSTTTDTDPVGSRDVNAEAQQELRSAKQSAAGHQAPMQPKTFTRQSDRSAANTIRLALGSNPLSTRTHFGENAFLPDFTILFEILSIMDRKMIATDKFTRTAEFWTPLVSRIYLSVICIVQIFAAMRSAGRLDYENELFLEWFQTTFSASTLPIPGPLVNIVNCISNAAVAATNYRSHAPVLPITPPTIPATYKYCIANNLVHRLPNPLLLLHQYYHHLTFAVTGTPTGTTVGRWAEFGRHLFSGTLMAAPTSAAARTLLTATAAEQLWLHHSPGFSTPYMCNTTIGNNLLDYSDEMLLLLPLEISTATDPTDTAVPSWRVFLGFGSSHTWFVEFARIMTDYCKFWKESCPYADLAPVGHSGSLVQAAPSRTKARPTTRFPQYERSYAVTTFSLAIPESDELDGCIALLNCANTSTNTGLPRPNVPPTAPASQSGPYYQLATAKSGRDVNPLDGVGQILSDHYHVPNPKA